MWFLILCLALSLEGTGAAPPVQSRVVGGSECGKNSHPWQVAIYRFSTYQCGGVLVHPQWVLTAAHCYSDNYQIWLGRHDLFEDEESAQHMLVSQSFPHPNFNLSFLNTKPHPGDDYSHDVMLLRLAQPVKLTDTIKVLDLPTEDPKIGSTCIASGWGSTHPSELQYPDVLQCVDLKLLPNEVCENGHPQMVTEFMLCAGYLEGGKDTCVGDSGGPLLCDGMLQGITSWGSDPCGSPNMGGIYVKLIKYVDWIQGIMEENP